MLHRILGVVLWIVVGLLVACPILDLVPADVRETRVFRWLLAQKESWPPILAIVLGGVEILRQKVLDPKKLDDLQSVLDAIADVYEKENGPEGVQATLFRWTRFPLSWLFSAELWRRHGVKTWKKRPLAFGWLVPLRRSGDVLRRSQTLFYCPSNDEANAEGFAGACRFRKGNAMTLTGRCPQISEGSDESEVSRYGELTFIHPELVRERQRQGRSLNCDFRAIPILDEGRFWGVLVLDAPKPDTIRKQAPVEVALMASLAALTKRLG